MENNLAFYMMRASQAIFSYNNEKYFNTRSHYTLMKPLEVIHASLQKRVLVELKGGREYRGILEGYDHPHLNLILKNAEEYIEGEKKREIEKVIVRGDNIIYISP